MPAGFQRVWAWVNMPLRGMGVWVDVWRRRLVLRWGWRKGNSWEERDTAREPREEEGPDQVGIIWGCSDPEHRCENSATNSLHFLLWCERNTAFLVFLERKLRFMVFHFFFQVPIISTMLALAFQISGSKRCLQSQKLCRRATVEPVLFRLRSTSNQLAKALQLVRGRVEIWMLLVSNSIFPDRMPPCGNSAKRALTNGLKRGGLWIEHNRLDVTCS